MSIRAIAPGGARQLGLVELMKDYQAASGPKTLPEGSPDGRSAVTRIENPRRRTTLSLHSHRPSPRKPAPWLASHINVDNARAAGAKRMPNDPPQPVREWEADRACSWAAFAPTSLSNQRSAVLRRVQSDPARNPARIQPGA